MTRKQQQTIGDRIVQLRTAMGINQAELARRADIKAPSLWEIESGTTVNPRVDTLVRLADELNVSTRYLFDGQDDPESLTATERYVVARMRKMSPQQVAILRDMVGSLCKAGQRRAQ